MKMVVHINCRLVLVEKTIAYAIKCQVVKKKGCPIDNGNLCKMILYQLLSTENGICKHKLIIT